MANDPNILDSDELLHLAIVASQQNNHEEAITHLKHALKKNPKDSKACYMLGAEHAEIGMYPRAIEDLSKAVSLDPSLITAHFQLGLLYITSGQVPEAEEAWKELDTLGKNNPLFLFKTGLLHLAKDEFEPCLENLQRGMEQNQQNPALNKDMMRIIDDVRSTMKGNAHEKINSDVEKNASKDESSSASHIFLSAYKDDDSGSDS